MPSTLTRQIGCFHLTASVVDKKIEKLAATQYKFWDRSVHRASKATNSRLAETNFIPICSMNRRTTQRLLCFFGVLELTALAAVAHPVAQGAMDIVVSADCIEIQAHVSTEEVFVAEAFGGKADAKGSLDDVWRRHGGYFLSHFQLTADGVPLAGEVRGIAPPGKTVSRVTYDLRFDLPAARQDPGRIVLRQNVLNEFIFAPGNRWETSYIVRISQRDRPTREGLLLTSREPLAFTCSWTASAVATATPSHLDERAMAGAFLRHGIRHILGGYDHLLFVAGLVLAVVSIFDLLKVVTAFTLAHTLTLTLAVLDIVRLSNRIVEPMIAASIVFVAVQNLLYPTRTRGWTRLGIAFGFGLFHGLGFAGGLLSAMEGMAGVAIVTAIAAFSFGVEIGHQIVALPLFGVLKITRAYSSSAADPEWIPRWATSVGSSAICAAGLVYLVAALR
jgi:HupE / UreJ protein